MRDSSSSKRIGDDPVILIVDDEPSVLSSLRRLFRGKNYEVVTESSPAKALQRIDDEPIDLIISDMRMPEINGTEVLRHAAACQPNSVRILLTGYADLEDAIEAVNSGGIFRYLTKPWDNNAILEAVESGLYVKELERSNEKLANELSRQNAALKDLTATLAGRVRNRNRDFESNLSALQTISENLGSDLDAIIRLVIGMIEDRSTSPRGSTLRIANYARALAEAAGCEADVVQQVSDAALFHELGKVELEPATLNTPEEQLAPEQRKLLRKNAALAACILGQTNRYQGAAKILRHVYEHFDGCGEPDQLSRIAIPLGSRILAVACAYEKLRAGTIVDDILSPQQAMEWIEKRAGRNFDPQIVAYLAERLADFEAQRTVADGPDICTLSLSELQPGMELVEDLISQTGLPLYLTGQTLTSEGLARLQEFQSLTGAELTACVRQE